MSAAIQMNSNGAEQAHFMPARLQAGQQELIERIQRVVRTDGSAEPLPGLFLNRASTPGEPLLSVYDPMFCVIAQGSKEVLLSNERYLYDAANYLIVTANLPVVAHVVEASTTQPYLSLSLKLDPLLVSQVMVEAGHTALPQRASVRALNVSPLEPELLEAVVRLVRLADDPGEARFMAPLITREIIYRLLNGEQCDRLRYIVVQNGHVHHIARAIEQFRKEFDQPLPIERVAQELGMSVSSFPSPLQGGHGHESAAVSEAAAPARGAAADAGRGARCGQRRLPRRLSRCVPLQPGIQKHLRRVADARCAAAARRRGRRPELMPIRLNREGRISS
jgi:hypothetical protein